MNSKNSQIKRIFSKFQELKSLDGNVKHQTMKQNKLQIQTNEKKYEKKNISFDQDVVNDVEVKVRENKKQIFYTQSQISREVSKLKPYLIIKDNIRTTAQKQERENKKISAQNYKLMSDLVVYESCKLCEIFGKSQYEVRNRQPQRKQKEKEGWIFQIFYRSVENDSNEEILRKPFLSGYAVMTDRLQLFDSLRFLTQLASISPSSIAQVRYEQHNNYEVITILTDSRELQCGFIGQKQFDLFDRLLFMQKNMSRSTSNRLFQNQRLRSIYAQYQK